MEYRPHVETRLKEMTLPVFKPEKNGDVLHGSVKIRGLLATQVIGTFRCPAADMPRGQRKEMTFALHDSSQNVSGFISLYLRLQALAGVHVDNWVELGLGTRDLHRIQSPPEIGLAVGSQKMSS